MSGQRRACATMMPLSMLAASFGRPAASHLQLTVFFDGKNGRLPEMSVRRQLFKLSILST